MSEVIDLIPEEGIQNERTACMISAVNENHRRAARAEAAAHMAGQARIRELELQEQRRMEQIKELAWVSFLWAAGCSALVILAHTGTIAGWVMQVGTTALSFALGLTVGQTAKEGSV